MPPPVLPDAWETLAIDMLEWARKLLASLKFAIALAALYFESGGDLDKARGDFDTLVGDLDEDCGDLEVSAFV